MADKIPCAEYLAYHRDFDDSEEEDLSELTPPPEIALKNRKRILLWEKVPAVKRVRNDSEISEELSAEEIIHYEQLAGDVNRETDNPEGSAGGSGSSGGACGAAIVELTAKEKEYQEDTEKRRILRQTLVADDHSCGGWSDLDDKSATDYTSSCESTDWDKPWLSQLDRYENWSPLDRSSESEHSYSEPEEDGQSQNGSDQEGIHQKRQDPLGPITDESDTESSDDEPEDPNDSEDEGQGSEGGGGFSGEEVGEAEMSAGEEESDHGESTGSAESDLLKPDSTTGDNYNF